MRTHTPTAVAALLNNLTTNVAEHVEQGAAPLEALHHLIEALPVAAFVADDNGRYILTNALASELTGYSPDELRRLSVWQLTPGVNEHEAETLWRAFRQQRAQTGDYQLLTKSGQIVRAKYAARANVLPRMHVSLLDAHSDTVE